MPTLTLPFSAAPTNALPKTWACIHNNQTTGGHTMDQYVCEPCGYIYDPEAGDPDSGIAPGTAFEDIPEDWVCPVCGMGKDVFEKA